MAIRCSFYVNVPIREPYLINNPIGRFMMLQHNQVKIKKILSAQISSSLKNKVFEDQSTGIVCYRDSKGEIICEGYDEGPRIHQGLQAIDYHLRDAEIIELLQQNWLQVAKDDEQSMKGGETSWPYGETFFKHPTGRISDGRIVPDFIAMFAKLPMLPPYLEPGSHRFTDGSNFASGGAGVLGDSSHGMIDLRMQLSHFKEVQKGLKQKLGNVQAKKLLMRSVYLFSIGGNDYFRFYMGNSNASLASQQKHVNMVIGNLTEVLQEIHNMGGRKIGFQNAGPLGCVPSMRAKNPEKGKGCIKNLSALAALHNRALSNTLHKLQTELHGFEYSIFDYYNTVLELVNHPARHGFKEGKAACYGCGLYRGGMCGLGTNGTAAKYELCSDPSEYIWFDGGHTTEAANWVLAKLIWNGKSNVTGPWNLKKLFQLE